MKIRLLSLQYKWCVPSGDDVLVAGLCIRAKGHRTTSLALIAILGSLGGISHPILPPFPS